MTGTASETIASTERKVNWNDGSKRFSGCQTSNASAAPPITFSEFVRRQTTGAKITNVNISAARATEGSAPTAIVYAHMKVAAMRNCKSFRLVNLRVIRITR